VLTPGVGTMGFANVREASASTESREPPRAILVKDTPAVLAAVDRLVLELDHPERPGEKPAAGVQATPAVNVPPPPEFEPVTVPPPAPVPAQVQAPAPVQNYAAPQFEQRSGCAHCTSIAPPVITSGPRNNRR